MCRMLNVPPGIEAEVADYERATGESLQDMFLSYPEDLPLLFLHGDADVYSPMGSVRAWEQLRRMGIQGELHTLATRGHCFQRTASPGTGSYTWMDRVWEFLNHCGVTR